MLVGRQAKQAFEQMKEALTDAVMQSVGTRIVEASKEEQKKNSELLLAKIQEFEKSMRETARQIVKEELKNETEKTE